MSKIEFEVKENGIYRQIYPQEDMVKEEMIMDKETFVKAFEEYIEGKHYLVR